MPDIAMHRHMGQMVLERLPFSVDRDAFLLGVKGPDDWYSTRMLHPKARRHFYRLGLSMHRNGTGAFLGKLAEYSRGNEAMFAFTAGFIAHWCLDKTAHPYIEYRAEEKPFGHTLIERELDRRIDPSPRPLTKVKLTSYPPAMKEGLEAAYALAGLENSWDALNRAARDTWRFQWFVEDPHGILKALIRRPCKARAYLYSWHEPWDDPENLSHKEWYYPADPSITSTASFPELVEKAVSEACGWIEKLHAWVCGNGDLPVFPDQSYVTGLTVHPASA